MLLNCGVGENSWVPWTARRSNQSILKEIIPECSLEGLMLKLKLQYFGHLMRRTDSFEKTLTLGKIEGRRRRGRQRMRWLDGIADSMDMSLGKLRSWWGTERPGVMWSMGSQSDMTVWLNWTELKVWKCERLEVLLWMAGGKNVHWENREMLSSYTRNNFVCVIRSRKIGCLEGWVLL